MPDKMKAREFIRSFYSGDPDDEDSEAGMAMGMMDEFLKWQKEQHRRITNMYNPPVPSYHDLLDKRDRVLLRYSLIKTERRLTFDIIYQDEYTRNRGTDDTPIVFKASNGVEVITRSRMDIQTDRIWLLGCSDDTRSGSMPFSDNDKRDKMYDLFQTALQEWSQQV
jgi:hypothetical protein